MPDFTDAELRQIYQNPKADLSLLSQDELGRLDRLTQPSTGPHSYLQDVGATLKGEAKGAIAAFNPMNIVSGIKTLATTNPIDTLTNTVQGIKQLATEGSAEDIGNAIGGVLGGAVMGKAIPMGLKAAPTAMVRTGNVLNEIGTATKPASIPVAVSELAFSGNLPKAAGVVAAPWAMEQGGRLLSKAGVKLGGRLPTNGARLATSAEEMKPISDVLNDVRGMDTANDIPDMAGASKPIAKIATKNRVSLEPSVRPNDMVATLPDKWGTTYLGDADRALRSPQSFGPLRSAASDLPVAPKNVGPGFTAGETQGADALERFLDAKYGADRPTIGNGQYRAESGPLTRTPTIGPPRPSGTAWDKGAGPTLTSQERALLEELSRQPETPRSEIINPDFAQGRELGQLLQRLSNLKTVGHSTTVGR